jgi:hypothetical protein
MAAILADAGEAGPGFGPPPYVPTLSGRRAIPLESLQDGCTAAYRQCINCLEG